MSATCNGCGDCCDAIYLDPEYHEENMAERARRGQADARFIQEHWHPITAEVALARVPGFRRILLVGRFLECDQFDRETRRCLARETRPEICRGFPWYGGPYDVDRIMPFDRCSYRTDTMPMVIIQ